MSYVAVLVISKYNLNELSTIAYTERTLKIVQSSDGNLIIYSGSIYAGTKKTIDFCFQHNKPFLDINLLEKHQSLKLNFHSWININNITILNVVGPRESELPIYDRTILLLFILLSDLKV